MNRYAGSIDTDAAIGTILGNFETEYVNHVIDDSLKMKFRPFAEPMPNLADVLDRKIRSVADAAPDYLGKVEEVRSETHQEIIRKICNYYGLQFIGDFESMNVMEIYGISHTMYDIFISRFSEYLIDFFVSYIVKNSDAIYAYLQHDENTKKPKEAGMYSPKNYISDKYILIHANINSVIYNMIGYDISFQEMLSYFVTPDVAARLGSLFVDTGNIFRTHYGSLVTDQITSAGVLTNVKLKLQSRTISEPNSI